MRLNDDHERNINFESDSDMEPGWHNNNIVGCPFSGRTSSGLRSLMPNIDAFVVVVVEQGIRDV